MDMRRSQSSTSLQGRTYRESRSKDRNSRLPILRRSNSSSNTAESTSKIPAYTRSSSISNARLTTSHAARSLFASDNKSRTSAFAMQIQRNSTSTSKLRQNSYAATNLFGSSQKLFTPINQTKKLQVPNSSGKRVSPWRALQDKDVQRKELARIRQVLSCIDDRIIFEKPIVIRNFFLVLKTIFEHLSLNVQLTFENYVTLVPTCLKNISYNGTCTASMLKTANTMHNYPHVLGILSYLCTLCEMQNTILPMDDESKITRICIDTQNKNKAEKTSKQQELLNKFPITVAQEFGIDLQDHKKRSTRDQLRDTKQSSQTDIKSLKSEYEEGNRMVVETEKLINIQDVANMEFRKDFELKEKDITEKTTHFEQLLSCESKKLNLLQEKFAAQVYTKQDETEVQQNIEEAKTTGELQKQRNDGLVENLNKMHVDLGNKIVKLKTLVIGLNAHLSLLAIHLPSLESIILPETGFRTLSGEYFDALVVNIMDCLDKNNPGIAQTELRLKALQTLTAEKLITRDHLLREVNRFNKDYEYEMELKGRDRHKFEDKLQQLTNELEMERSNHLNIIDKWESQKSELETYNKLLSEQNKKKNELNVLRIHARERADSIISKLSERYFKASNERKKIVKSYMSEKTKKSRKV